MYSHQAERIEMYIYTYVQSVIHFTANFLRCTNKYRNFKYTLYSMRRYSVLFAVHFQWHTATARWALRIFGSLRLPLCWTESTSLQSRGENTNTFGLKGTNRREWERCSRASRLKYEMIIYTFGVSVHSLNSASRLMCKVWNQRGKRRSSWWRNPRFKQRANS